MEQKNFNKAYIFILSIFAIGLAVSNLISFFNGFGIAFVGSIVLLILAIYYVLKDEQNKKRFGDIFILITIEFLMFIVLFFAFDFNIKGITNNFPYVMRNICAIYSLLAVVYIVFRYVSEIKGKKFKFVEFMLGNYIPESKPSKAKLSKEEIKKNKELENGTFEPKPSSIENVTEVVTEEETADKNIEDTTETEEENTVKDDTSSSNRTGFWY